MGVLVVSSELMKGAVVGAVAASVVMIATAALAGTGIGGVFNLGKTNKVNAQSTLTGKAGSSNLQLTNTGSGPALGLTVGSGKAPLVVNAKAGKATNLNADKLDGLNSTDLERALAFRTLTFHAIGSGTPTRHKLGTVLGDTFYADCLLTGGNAEVRVYLQTSNGDWTVGFGQTFNDSGTTGTETNVDKSTSLTTPTEISLFDAQSNGSFTRTSVHTDLVQIAPQTGHLVVHETAEEPANTCDVWLQASPS